jgi:SAM-dependent methyltransferase
MEIIQPERFHSLIDQAQLADFSGWDFRWLEGRLIEEKPPWDYFKIVQSHLPAAHSLLDMGTGGGEFLISLGSLPPDTHATEAFPPNQILAQERLAPLGVMVHNILDEQPLPFEDGYFDLIINRHEWYDPNEVFRILKPDGVFITQQVSGLDNLELHQVLEKAETFPVTKWSLAEALTGLYQANFRIERAEKSALACAFLDIGAVVYYLKAVPWEIKDFSPESYNDELVKLHNIIERQGRFMTTAHRFLIVARKRSK